MSVSVLIITKNRPAEIQQCVPVVLSQLSSHDELVVVDSSESDTTQTLMKGFSRARYFRVGFGPGTRPQSYSYGAERCRGEIVVLLDDDAIPHEGWLEELVRCYEDARIGAVGGRVLSQNPESDVSGEVSREWVGRVLANGRIRNHCEYDGPGPFEVDTLRGCNMSVRRSLFERIGYFDPRYTGQNCRVEDDLCLRIKRVGYRVVFNPKAVVTHLAAERADVPRAGNHPRSVFYVARNTVYLYLKNFGLRPKLLWCLLVWNPLVDGARYVLKGGVRRFRGIQPRGLWLAFVNLWGTWAGLSVSLMHICRLESRGTSHAI